jgi:hypothetical protein
MPSESDVTLLLDAFFHPKDSGTPQYWGWQHVSGYDAWTHEDTGEVVTGHQMRMSFRMGLVPKASLSDKPWL